MQRAAKPEEEPERVSKAHHIVSRRSPEPASSYPFQKVHFDLIVHYPAYNGNRYVLHFVDDYCNHHKVFTFPTKGAINTGIIYYVNWVKNKFGIDIETFQIDGEKAISKSTKNVLRSLGITLQQSAPYTPDQNGKAEEAWVGEGGSGQKFSTLEQCMAITKVPISKLAINPLRPVSTTSF